jgi:hypothetical protein
LKFIAKCKCQFGGRIYKKGEEMVNVPCEVTETNPPLDYFARISDDEPCAPVEEKEVDVDMDMSSRESWMRKLDEKGIPYDKRWGAAKLQAEFINASRGA